MCSPSTLLATISATAPRSAATVCLSAERARAAVDQHHGARDGQAVVVGRRAARACRRRGRRTSGPVTPSGAVPDGELQRRGLHAPSPPTVSDGSSANGRSHLEVRRLHVETLVPQHPGDVVGAGVVAGRAQGAVAAVGVGDLLQLLQVRHHRVGGDLLSQCRGEVGRRIGPCGARGSRLQAPSAPTRDDHRHHCQGFPHHRHHVSLLRAPAHDFTVAVRRRRARRPPASRRRWGAAARALPGSGNPNFVVHGIADQA